MFKNKALILAKKETSYGVDPTPTTAANAILCDLPVGESIFKRMERLNVKPFLGNRPAISLGEALKVSFSTEVRGSGDATPNTPPEIGVLFVGCGMLEDVDDDSGAISITFAETGKTITRGTGSFVTDGFAVGDVITTDAALNPGPFTVTVVNPNGLVLTVAETVVDEGPVTKTVTMKKVEYTPQDDLDGPSITIYFWQDGHKYVLLGCRGTWSLEAPAGEFAKIKWEFTGLYAGPADDSIPTDAVYNATIPPALKSANFLLGSYAGIIANFKLAYGNEIVKRPSANASTGFLAQFIKDRKVTAQIDPEADTLANFNPLALAEGSTEQTMGISVGTSPGNRMVLSCPKVVVDTAKYADRENILTWDGALLVCPSAGEDDITVKFN
jgi:hypothetical protein